MRDEGFYVPLSGSSQNGTEVGAGIRVCFEVRKEHAVIFPRASHTLGLDHSVGSVTGHWLYIHSKVEELFTSCKYLPLSALRVYVRQCKWNKIMYLYVNKRTELAQRGIELYTIMYFYIFIIINCLYSHIVSLSVV